MSTDQNKALVRQWWHDFNAHHLDFETFIHPEMLNHAVPPQRQRGFDHFKATITDGLASVPDQHWTIDDLISEEDKVVCHMTWSGTLQGGYHIVVPTQRHFSIHHVHTFRITDGKFSEHWVVRAVRSLPQRKLRAIHEK